MSELRWNPLLRTYTMVAANRQKRPHLPKNWCPFCPESGNVPKDYQVHVYPNDYPVLTLEEAKHIGFVPYETNQKDHSPYANTKAYGQCEVILYSPNHHGKLYELSLDHLTLLVQTWAERLEVLRQEKRIQYIFPFENRGEEVGVTMPHPHGQLYAYSFVPLKIKTELESCQQFYQETGQNLFAAMNEEELADGRRIIMENEHFLAYLPYFTDYPFGVFIVSKAQKIYISEFTPAEQQALAEMLKNITGAFDQIYNRPFPYMMCMHQAPVNAPIYAGAKDYYRFHIEFYPPLRAADKIKWYASSEMGAWAAANVVAVEESAKTLRKALQRFLILGS